MNRSTRWIAGAACVAALLGAAPPARPSEGYTPIVTLTNPSTNGQVVNTLRNSEGFPTLGAVNAPTGLNRCTVEYKRVSDSYYWNGTAWISSVFTFSPTITGVNPSPPYYNFREDAGPNSGSMTSGAQYLVWAECVETNGTRASATVTVTKA
jgi:hypothetical protein